MSEDPEQTTLMQVLHTYPCMRDYMIADLLEMAFSNLIKAQVKIVN